MKQFVAFKSLVIALLLLVQCGHKSTMIENEENWINAMVANQLLAAWVKKINPYKKDSIRKAHLKFIKEKYGYDSIKMVEDTRILSKDPTKLKSLMDSVYQRLNQINISEVKH